MLNASVVTLVIGWLLPLLIHLTGNLVWDNRLL